MARGIRLALLLFGLAGIPAHLALAQYYFGRNKVQYNYFDWQVLKTDHFDIYFYPEMEELARIGAAFAEESYSLLEDRFNHTIERRIPLIFYSNHFHFQQTNTTPYLVPEGVGGFFEFLKGRVVVPADGSMYKFKRVIRHELVHVFTHSKFSRIMKEHRKLEGADLPLWYVEGLAEYYSEGWGSEAEMFVRDAVLNGYFVPLATMYQIYGSFLMYKEGQCFLRFLASEYGEEKVLQLIDNVWKADRFSRVLEITTRKPLERLDEEWLYWLKKRTYPVLAHADLPQAVTRPIATDGICAKPAFLRLNGSPHVVYLSNRNGYTDVYLQSLDTTASERPRAEVLIRGERTADFESFHLLRSKLGVSGRGQLAFISKSGPRDVIYVFDIPQRRILHAFQWPELVTMASPAWSPDGRRIAFTAIEFGGQSDLYLVDVETGRLERLTNDFYEEQDPSWSPDGRHLAFASDRGASGEHGYLNLFVLDTATGHVSYLTSGPHHDLQPAWSPDGRYLAYSSDRGGQFDIWLAKVELVPAEWQVADRSSAGVVPSSEPVAVRVLEQRRITSLATGAFDPAWTDEKALLFAAFANYSYQIRALDKVEESYQRAEPCPPDSLGPSEGPWPIARYAGRVAATKVPYRRKFSLDIAQSQITQDPIFGTSGGAQVAISDVLGNHQYYFLLYNNARTRDEFLESFNVAVSRVDLSHRTNYAIGAYHFAGRYYSLYDFFFWERRYGGFIALSYPFSVFQRVEGSLNIRNSDKEWFASGYRRQALLVSNFISLIKDNSLWGPTGPLDGERYDFTLGNTIDVAHSRVNFYTLIADYRRYLRLSRQVTYALRFTTMVNDGKEATPFFLGGSWDLRGYPLWRIWGTKTALVSQELRFPFIERFVIRFPVGGIAFSAIRGATFVDLGNGWDHRLDRLLGSAGFGIRFQLGGVLVLRFDLGKKFSISNPDRLRSYTSPDVQSGLFTQFFFGYDF